MQGLTNFKFKNGPSNLGFLKFEANNLEILQVNVMG